MAAILIVEDDPLVRELTEMTVEHYGHSTCAAGDVEEALRILRTDQGIDLLFTDIFLMSAMFGGCDLAREAVRLRPGLPVLYTTGNPNSAALMSRFVEGAQFIRKPYTEPQLRSALNSILGPRV